MFFFLTLNLLSISNIQSEHITQKCFLLIFTLYTLRFIKIYTMVQKEVTNGCFLTILFFPFKGEFIFAFVQAAMFYLSIQPSVQTYI